MCQVEPSHQKVEGTFLLMRLAFTHALVHAGLDVLFTSGTSGRNDPSFTPFTHFCKHNSARGSRKRAPFLTFPFALAVGYIFKKANRCTWKRCCLATITILASPVGPHSNGGHRTDVPGPPRHREHSSTPATRKIPRSRTILSEYRIKRPNFHSEK